MNYPYI